MKTCVIRLSLFAIVIALAVGTVHAQTTAPRKKKKRTTTAKKSNTSKNNANNAAVTPVQDTTKKVVELEADIKLDTPLKSLRNDAAVERNLIKDRTPLAYQYIREDDAVYRQRVWREINVHEKMNLPFAYSATEDNGNQLFINILLNAIRSGEITAFDPIDDRFTTPYTFKQIAGSLVGKPRHIQVADLDKDPDGSKGYMKDTTITELFDATKIERYWIKEEWVFDKQSSRMYARILGIAPLKTITESDGVTFRAVAPVFWVYYPDLRPMLAKFEAYNGKNFGARMSWEELFESRMFASRIIMSSMDNPGNKYIKDYIKDPILALLEGDNIKEKVFNYEQDLWSY
jgi:gliding motility associated protien GldN